MKILILGSSGFIGKSLARHLNKEHSVVSLNRKTDVFKLFENTNNFDFVINCASSKLTSSSIESDESNFFYPKSIFHESTFKHWIQIESYFQLQIPLGRRDQYTITKQRFTDYLDSKLKTVNSPSIHHLYLPHIFDINDGNGRLISSVISSIKNGVLFNTTNGSQFLPILHAADAVLGIAKFIQNPSPIAACHPFWYGTISELLEIISLEFKDFSVCYGSKPDPVDANFPKVKFPNCIDGWQPKMHMNEFLEWIKVQSE